MSVTPLGIILLTVVCYTIAGNDNSSVGLIPTAPCEPLHGTSTVTIFPNHVKCLTVKNTRQFLHLEIFRVKNPASRESLTAEVHLCGMIVFKHLKGENNMHSLNMILEDKSDVKFCKTGDLSEPAEIFIGNLLSNASVRLDFFVNEPHPSHFILDHEDIFRERSLLCEWLFLLFVIIFLVSLPVVIYKLCKRRQKKPAHVQMSLLADTPSVENPCFDC